MFPRPPVSNVYNGASHLLGAPMSKLFSPLQLAEQTLPNRIVVSPMCQYSAVDGCATDWHLQHLMQLAISRAGLVILEATAVERRGRITHGCLGLYSDANVAALERALNAARRVADPDTKFGIQLAHAGRKASAHRPWEGGRALGPDEDPWPTIAPSAVPVGRNWPTPTAMDPETIEGTIAAFAESARQAMALGFDAVELHGAHGYLLHQFLSPVSNRREDQYGGSLQNRMRFALQVARAVRAVVPHSHIVGMRITGTDWHQDGVTPEDAVTLTRELQAEGLNYVCVSSGGIVPGLDIPVEPGYQVPLAERVKRETGMPTQAVGMILEPLQAERLLEQGRADMVALARAVLDNPRWPWHAAQALGEEMRVVPQYERSLPHLWPGASLVRDD